MAEVLANLEATLEGPFGRLWPAVVIFCGAITCAAVQAVVIKGYRPPLSTWLNWLRG